MEQVLTYAIPVGMAVVAIILALGLFNMFRNNAEARTTSNKLMRLRVIAQFVVVVLLMLFLYLTQVAG